MTPTSRPVSQPTSHSTSVMPRHQTSSASAGSTGSGTTDDRQPDVEEDGEQAALRLDPAEPQQLSHPGKAR